MKGLLCETKLIQNSSIATVSLNGEHVGDPEGQLIGDDGWPWRSQKCEDRGAAFGDFSTFLLGRGSSLN